MNLVQILLLILELVVVQSYIRNYNEKFSIRLSGSIKPTNNDRALNEEPRPMKRLSITGDIITPTRSFKLSGKKDVEYVDSFFEFKHIPNFNLPEIAILGRSNVGKSSLLNMLAGAQKNIAVVSKMPGRTRCVNLFRCKDPRGPFAMLVDLPGYGFARMSKELRGDISHAAVAYLRRRRSLLAALLLIDCRRGYQESDKGVMELLDSLGIPYGIIVTKVDKLSSVEFDKVRNDVQIAKADSNNFPVVMSSSETGFGKKEIWATIKHHMVVEDSSGEAETDESVEEQEELRHQRKGPEKKVKFDPSTAVEWFPGD